MAKKTLAKKVAPKKVEAVKKEVKKGSKPTACPAEEQNFDPNQLVLNLFW